MATDLNETHNARDVIEEFPIWWQLVKGEWDDLMGDGGEFTPFGN